MTTAEAIEGITDAGLFEILATRVLRLVDEDCKFLEHMGVNAEGKTIVNPVDGFCLVPGTNPPRFVMAAFTTDKVDNLRRKWLFDHSAAPKAKKATSANDGDLIKASRRLQSLLTIYPNAVFIVHLCTNKQPDDTLMEEVLASGLRLGIDVRFLGRSRIRDALDTTRDGQWLRKEHLGMQAERLSLPLLRELAEQSLEQYGREFLITLPASFVSTNSGHALEREVVSNRSVYVVTGASGTGKSVSCFQLLKRHLVSGGVGLWIPGEVAARASTLEEAIYNVLRTHHPIIEATAGADALALTCSTGHMLLVIDDIIRGGSPVDILRKLLSWRRPSSQNQDVLAQHSIIVPVWDLFWAPLEPQFRSVDWLANVVMNRMTEDESSACLMAALGSRSHQFSAADLVNIVRILACDPILVALYADTIVENEPTSVPSLAIEVIHKFIQLAQGEAAASNNHIQIDYELSLVALAEWMLSNRNLYPSWKLLQEKLPNNTIEPIRDLVRHGKICRISGRTAEARFEFRHDRILEYYLSLAFQKMFTEFEANGSIISDPYYTSFVGLALASNYESKGLVPWLEKNAPLSIFASIRFLPPQNCSSTNIIIRAAIRCLRDASQSASTPSLMLVEAYRILEETDSPCIIEITDKLHGSWFRRRSRLANGSADEILTEFANSRLFAPSTNDKTLDAVFNRALHRYREKLVYECAVVLECDGTQDNRRRGALVLAGFIAESSLAAAIRNCWNSFEDKYSVIVPALWAGLRCGDSDPATILGPIVDEWGRLSDFKENDGYSDRLVIAVNLQFAISRGIPVSCLNFMIDVARKIEGLRWPITVLLKKLDDPIVIKFLLEESAERENDLNGSGGFSHFVWDLKDRWDPTSQRGKRLRPESIQVMRSCWESETADEQLRKTAFKIWLRATDDLNQLCAIQTSHPQFESVLWRRAVLRDVSTVPLILPLVDSDKNWLGVFHYIWSTPLKPAVDDALASLASRTPDNCLEGKTNSHFLLAELIRDIPVVDGEALLLKHWSELRFSPLFVQAALYIGTPACIAKAKEAIGMYPETENPFEYISNYFGFFTTGLADRLEERHLIVLLPFLARLDDHALSDMAEYCLRQGRNHNKWASLHLKPEFDRRRTISQSTTTENELNTAKHAPHHFPSDDDLRGELGWIEQQGDHAHWHVSHWSEGFDERQDDHSRWFRLLDEWLAERPILTRFSVVASAVQQHGTRRDLELLRNREIGGDILEIEKHRANSVFGVMRRTLL